MKILRWLQEDPFRWMVPLVIVTLIFAFGVALLIGGEAQTQCGVNMANGQYVCVVKP